MTALIKYLTPLLISVALLINGCEKNDFKQSCLESRAIMLHATSLLLTSVEKTKNSDQRDIVVKSDNSRAIGYLQRKDQRLKQYYKFIKSSIINPDKNYYDAIYAASYINELYYFLTGNALDDRCYYLDLVEKNINSQLSIWLINDFFAPLKEDTKYKKSWINMDYAKKRALILRMLTETRKKCDSSD